MLTQREPEWADRVFRGSGGRGRIALSTRPDRARDEGDPADRLS